MSPLRIDPLAATGIGSLPYTQLELAIQQAFSLDIPYLPQLPRRDPAEQLVPMALDGFPGLRWDAEGLCTVQFKQWRREARAFEKRLDRALQKDELSAFEPQATSCRAWKPFLWELIERKARIAKAQLGGPVTCAWAVRLDDGRRAVDEAELAGQIYRLVLARSLAMARAIGATGAAAILFFDEPGLVALEPRHPQHLLRLQELRLAVLALVKEGARPGLHCCGNAGRLLRPAGSGDQPARPASSAWGTLLGLGLSYLSIDARLSLAAILAEERAFAAFLEEGGRLALGIVPTDLGSSPDLAVEVARGALAVLERSEPGEKVLGQCLVTPACGLALRSVADTAQVFAALARGQAVLREALAAGVSV